MGLKSTDDLRKLFESKLDGSLLKRYYGESDTEFVYEINHTQILWEGFEMCWELLKEEER